MKIAIRCFLVLIVSFQSLYAMGRSTAEPIGVTTFSWQDTLRNRPVTVECWYPTEDSRVTAAEELAIWQHPKESRHAAFSSVKGRLPLIVISHGYGGDRRDKSWLAAALVKKGFVVASIDHYGNTRNTLDHLATLKFWERPKDVSFALDQLLQDPFLKEHLDPSRIGFVAYSLAGMVGLELAGGSVGNIEAAFESQKKKFGTLPDGMLEQVDLSPLKENRFEPRIKAVLLMAPATWCFNQPESFQSIRTPIAIIGTLADELLPFDEHLRPLIQYSVPRRLKLLRNGASHFSFLNVSSKVGQTVLHDRMAFDPPGINRLRIHEDVSDFAAEFFTEYLPVK